MMKLFITISFAAILLLAPVAVAQSLQSELYEDISDDNLDDFSHIEAAFIISGADSEGVLEDASSWFQKLLGDIRSKRIVDVFEKESSAARLFQYLHATWLKTYVKEATTLLDIMERKEFNCVSATILYNLTCDEMGLQTMAFETPTHVYTIFSNFERTVMVENTTPIGFNIYKNLNAYSRYMRQYYPENRMYQIGLDRLYAYENAHGRRITNTELLGLISYNQAYFAFEDKNYDDSYAYVLLAQQFNRDSRSNQRFEKRLYYAHGKVLFSDKNYPRAFQLFADAAYRYPDNPDFRKNCIAAFMNALKSRRGETGWQDVVQMHYEMLDLDILGDKELRFLRQYLLQRAEVFIRTDKMDQATQAVGLLRDMGIYDDHVKSLERVIDNLH
ncbi:MAG: hypothetical protein V2J62_07630 [candidate division KSB1 bacterium]|jgi:hypothetical protein|nr:hypothetical protein [candidate division KSB1 bacterium]